MFKDGKIIVKILIISLVVIGVIGYSIFQARNLIEGPEIVLKSPETGSTMGNALVSIQGSAKNISYISLNDHQIFVDKDGLFKEELLLSPGYNVWKLEAKDKFGRIVSKKIELVFNKTL
jgi:hypothetical protein